MREQESKRAREQESKRAGERESVREEIAILEKPSAGVGDDEPILAGKRVLERELERHQKKPNGPKNTAKHIEAKQNWFNRESKRIETESAKLAEMQESLRVRKETLRAACEEIKILRQDLLEPLHVSGEHRRNSNPLDTTVQRRKMLAACWKLRDSTEKWKQRKENSKRRSRKNLGERLGWTGWISVVVKVQTRILQSFSDWERFAVRFAPVDRSGVSESVEVERGWTVGGLHRHFPVADLDAHRLGRVDVARMLRKLDGVNVGAHELFTPPELLGGSKIAGGAARWTAVELGGQLTFISAHLPHKGKTLG